MSGPSPAEHETGERCAITELLNLPQSPAASLALARVAPGVTTRLHAVENTVEVYVILSGEGRVEIDGRQARVQPGDRVIIPPGTPQRIENSGVSVLEFYCVCTPRFRPEAYRDLER